MLHMYLPCLTSTPNKISQMKPCLVSCFNFGITNLEIHLEIANLEIGNYKTGMAPLGHYV